MLAARGTGVEWLKKEARRSDGKEAAGRLKESFRESPRQRVGGLWRRRPCQVVSVGRISCGNRGNACAFALAAGWRERRRDVFWRGHVPWDWHDGIIFCCGLPQLEPEIEPKPVSKAPDTPELEKEAYLAVF